MTPLLTDARARRLLVSQAPLDRVPAAAFLPSLTGVLGAGVVLSQRLSPDAALAAAVAAAQAIAGVSSGKPGGVWRWTAAETEEWAARLAGLAPVMADEPLLYFSVRWGTLGALRAAPMMILPHAVALASQSLGCLLTSASGTDGLRLDLVDEDPARSTGGSFELVVWGERWGRAAPGRLGRTPAP